MILAHKVDLRRLSASGRGGDTAEKEPDKRVQKAVAQVMGRLQCAHDVVEHDGFTQNKGDYQHKSEKPPAKIRLMDQHLKLSQITASKQAVQGEGDHQQQEYNIKNPFFLSLHP